MSALHESPHEAEIEAMLAITCYVVANLRHYDDEYGWYTSRYSMGYVCFLFSINVKPW